MKSKVSIDRLRELKSRLFILDKSKKEHIELVVASFKEVIEANHLLPEQLDDNLKDLLEGRHEKWLGYLDGFIGILADDGKISGAAWAWGGFEGSHVRTLYIPIPADELKKELLENPRQEYEAKVVEHHEGAIFNLGKAVLGKPLDLHELVEVFVCSTFQMYLRAKDKLVVNPYISGVSIWSVGEDNIKDIAIMMLSLELLGIERTNEVVSKEFLEENMEYIIELFKENIEKKMKKYQFIEKIAEISSIPGHLLQKYVNWIDYYFFPSHKIMGAREGWAIIGTHIPYMNSMFLRDISVKTRDNEIWEEI